MIDSGPIVPEPKDMVSVPVPRKVYEELKAWHAEMCVEDPEYAPRYPTVEHEIAFGIQLSLDAIRVEHGQEPHSVEEMRELTKGT